MNKICTVVSRVLELADAVQVIFVHIESGKVTKRSQLGIICFVYKK